MKAITFAVVLCLAASAFAKGLETHFLVQMSCDGVNQTAYWDITCKSTSQTINTKVGGDYGIKSDIKGLTGSIVVASGTLQMASGSFVEFNNMTFGTHQNNPHSVNLQQVAGHTTDIQENNYMGVTYQIISGTGSFENAEGYISGIFNLDIVVTNGHLKGYWDASGIVVVPASA